MAAPSPLVVPVVELLRKPGRRRSLEIEVPVDDVAPGGITVIDARIPAGAEVEVAVELESMANGIMVTGRVSAPFTAECRRCLGPVAGDLSTEVQELFALERTDTDGRGGNGRGGATTAPADEDTFTVSGEHVDLAPLAREALALELPLAPLCSETCAGLCPECGVDLNAGTCDCDRTRVDPRWAALDDLRGELG